MKCLSHTLSIISTIMISIAATAGNAQAQTPVQIGHEAGHDACGGYGVVKGLNPNGDGFLAVRSGPGSRNAMIDKIHNGQKIWFCDQQGAWVGIVYSRNRQTDCQVSSPVASRRPYSGPCRSGWVFRKYVRMLAG